MSDWQPIETAPRDGTRVLLWFPFTLTVEVPGIAWIGLWAQRETDEADGNVCWIEPEHRDECLGEPTHWMPLPEPPKEGRGCP